MFFSHCNSIMMVYVHTQCMRQQRGGAHRLLQQPLPPPDCLQPFALREPMFLQQLVHALVGLLLPIPDCTQRAGVCTDSLHSDLHLCTHTAAAQAHHTNVHVRDRMAVDDSCKKARQLDVG